MTVPQIVSPWVRIVEDPDRRLLDCCIFRDSMRIWHCTGALAGTGELANTIQAGSAFYHCTGRGIGGRMTRNPDITPVMPADADTPVADTPNGEPARNPWMTFDGREFHLLFVRGEGRVLHARSGDADRWDSPAVEAFADTQVVGPSIVRVRNLWCMYYCQQRAVNDELRWCVLLRTSLHLTQWSPPKVVYVADVDAANAGTSLAGPTLVRGPGGFYLLLGYARPAGQGSAPAPARVLFSQRHDRFAWGDKSYLSELTGVGAPTVFETTGGLYLARIVTRGDSPGSTVEIARLQFDD